MIIHVVFVLYSIMVYKVFESLFLDDNVHVHACTTCDEKMKK